MCIETMRKNKWTPRDEKSNRSVGSIVPLEPYVLPDCLDLIQKHYIETKYKNKWTPRDEKSNIIIG